MEESPITLQNCGLHTCNFLPKKIKTLDYHSHILKISKYNHNHAPQFADFDNFFLLGTNESGFENQTLNHHC